MATKKAGLNVNIPEFLYDELVQLIEKSGRSASLLECAREVNRAVLFYIVKHGEEAMLTDEVREFEESIRETFYALASFLSKNFAYIIDKTTKGTKWEKSPKELEEWIKTSTNKAMGLLMTLQDRQDVSKERELEDKLQEFIYPSKTFKGDANEQD